MWQLEDGHGNVFRADDLTIAEIERIEVLAGCPWEQVSPGGSAKHLRAVATVIGDRFGMSPEIVERFGLASLQPADDDLPEVTVRNKTEKTPPPFEVDGGRFGDRWVLTFTAPPFAFTAVQVRNEFTLRDLKLMARAYGG